jgi:hypothetical protein
MAYAQLRFEALELFSFAFEALELFSFAFES